MKKFLKISIVTFLLVLATANAVFAAGWKRGQGENSSRWWYELDNNQYYAGTQESPNWQWIDGNGDGTAECYGFDQKGWMYADTVTPDGYQVNRDGAWIVNGIVQIKNVNSANRNMRVSIQANGNNLVFELNDSQAAREFYNQLPLSVEIRNFGGIEKIFYPPKTLNISDAPAANAEVGTLAYYAPWGNIAIFYGRHGFSSGLYELGRVVSGSEHIRNMSDSIEVSKE